MSGTIPLLLLYAFLESKGTTLPFITYKSVREALSHEIGSE